MPYIETKAKIELAEGRRPQTIGELTYLIQQSFKSYIEYRGISYETFAGCFGAAIGACLDLAVRKVIEYENSKRWVNGDVW